MNIINEYETHVGDLNQLLLIWSISVMHCSLASVIFVVNENDRWNASDG